MHRRELSNAGGSCLSMSGLTLTSCPSPGIGCTRTASTVHAREGLLTFCQRAAQVVAEEKGLRGRLGREACRCTVSLRLRLCIRSVFNTCVIHRSSLANRHQTCYCIPTPNKSSFWASGHNPHCRSKQVRLSGERNVFDHDLADVFHGLKLKR